MQKHIQQFFKFIQDKEGKHPPLRLKLFDPQTWGKPTKEQLVVKGGLNLAKSDIKELPQGLKVGKFIDLSGCTSLKELPQGLEVGWSLDLEGCTSLKKLPQDLKVGGSLWLNDTPIAEKYSKEEIQKMLEEGGGFVNDGIYI